MRLFFMDLKYGEVYNLKIKDKDYKGIYLGSRAPRTRLKSKHAILINKPGSILCNYCLRGFNNYSFDKDNKLILKLSFSLFPYKNEISYLEELCKKFD